MKTRRDFLKSAGAAVISVTGVASASENPFGFVKMESGYVQVATEGKYGADDKEMQGADGDYQEVVKQPEGAFGDNEKTKGTHTDDKEMEGSCGGYKEPEAACGILKDLQDSCGAKWDPKVKEGKLGS